MMTYFFTRGFYTPFFVLLIGLFLVVAFFREENRLVTWTIIAFFLGNLLLVYVDNFIESFGLSPYSLMMTSQLLLLIPILMISSVIMLFKQEIIPSFQKPILSGKINLPFGIVSPVRRLFLIIYLFLSLSIFGMLLIQRNEMDWLPFLFIILYASLNALLEEVLWRGVLLSKLIALTNKRFGMVVTSVAFGLGTTMFGFSLIISTFYIFLGLLFGFLTLKSKSIIPAVIAHTLITIHLIISGWVMIPL